MKSIILQFALKKLLLIGCVVYGILFIGCEKKQSQPTTAPIIYHDSIYLNYLGYFPGYGSVTDSIIIIQGSIEDGSITIKTTHKSIGKYTLGSDSSGNYLNIYLFGGHIHPSYSTSTYSADTGTLYITSYISSPQTFSGHYTFYDGVYRFSGFFSNIPF